MYTSRINFPTEVECKINHGIWMQYCADRTYNALCCLLAGQSEIKCGGLVGTIDFFRLCGLRMRVMAERLAKFQTIRGGQVKFDQTKTLVPIPTHLENKTCVTVCLEVALETEKQVEQQLRELYLLAKEKVDFVTCELIEDVLIPSQLCLIRCIVGHLNTLELTGNCFYTFDRLTMQPIVRKMVSYYTSTSLGELERLPLVNGNKFVIMMIKTMIMQIVKSDWLNTSMKSLVQESQLTNQNNCKLLTSTNSCCEMPVCDCMIVKSFFGF